MKKRIGGKQLNRDTTARKALLRGLTVSLVEKETIETTAAKAAAFRPVVEKLVTVAKTGSVQARRQIQAFVQDGAVVKKLVDVIAPRFKQVKGGYTRVIRVGSRRGDDAVMVRISFTKLAEPAPVKETAKVVTPTEKTEKTAPIEKTAPKAVATPKVAKPKVVKKATKPTIGIRRGER